MVDFDGEIEDPFGSRLDPQHVAVHCDEICRCAGDGDDVPVGDGQDDVLLLTEEHLEIRQRQDVGFLGRYDINRDGLGA